MYDMDYSNQHEQLVKERYPLAMASMVRWLNEEEAARLREIDEHLEVIGSHLMASGLTRMTQKVETVERVARYLNLLKRALECSGE
jgi:hypothetical protein